MEDSEKSYIQDLIRHTEDSITFFSNKMKPKRERSVCAAFLRCLGYDFSTDDIVAQKDDPPDVIYGKANFEIRELYEIGRKRHDEYRERLKELKRAKTIDDTLFFIEWPNPISYSFVFANIESALSSKAAEYGQKICSTLDALVYVSLPQKVLDIRSEKPSAYELKKQGWRSVSFVIPPYSHVIYCKESGPEFLTKLEGKTYSKWKGRNGFFEI